MTLLYVDVSHYDVDRLGRQPDWDRVLSATSPVMCARATYGDPAGYHPATRHFQELQAGARAAGFTARGGYHNLIRGDQASINRQVDWLRAELDAADCTWAMVDVEPYPALVENGLWPRFDDGRRFADRWHGIESRTLAAYLPRWVWSGRLAGPDLRPLGCPLVASHYGASGGAPSTLYAAQGGDTGAGWGEYGNVIPSVWQFASTAVVPGLSDRTDINAIRDPAVVALLGGDPVATWRVARGLDKLLAQINEMAPNRSKASDGSIGDPAHRDRPSDHNPDAQGVVRARDFTHDPGHGADMGEISEALRLSRDRRITYVIFNRRVFSATNEPWRWRPYTGSNPHDKHMHVSVVPTSVADDTSEWQIGDTVEATEILDFKYDDGSTLKNNVHFSYLWARQILAELPGLRAAVQTLAEAVAVDRDITPEELTAAVQAGVAEAGDTLTAALVPQLTAGLVTGLTPLLEGASEADVQRIVTEVVAGVRLVPAQA